MALQNIGSGNKDDAFYRYKMPRMITKIEGRGNGIKTNVVNMVDIAKALARPASYTTKFFSCEFGAQSKFDEKTGVSLVNGAHDTAKLAALLENFIKKYVQCYGCGNPETEIVITKTQMITLKCAACGFVSDVDMRDKLTTFILKHPPEQKKGGKDKKALRRAEKERLKGGEVADEEQKKLKKEGKKKTLKEAPASKASKKRSSGSDEDRKSHSGSQADDEILDDEDEEEEVVQWKTDTSWEAAQRRIQEQLSTATAEMVMLSTDEPEEKKLKQGKEAATTTTKEANGGTNDLCVETIISEIKVNLKKGSTPGQLKSFLGSLSADPQDLMNALFHALFQGVEKGFAKDVERKRTYLEAAMQEDGSQMQLLKAIESFCSDASADAVKEVPLVLKVLYDADILEEECIMKWCKGGLTGDYKKYPIWKNIKPFIEWLQNAESESEEE